MDIKAFQCISILGCLLSFALMNAQLNIDAELRPRFEYRHGFQTLFPNGEDPAAFISQRTRLNTRYTMDKLHFYLSIQDIRVWGDVSQLNRGDRNGFGVHQAWGEILFSPAVSLKLGRQTLNYDDQRIFGDVGWVQQARSHDVALLRYKENDFFFDIGAGFNQDNESLTGTTLTTPRTYKSIQFAWLHKDWKNVSGSFLFLNNGLQFIDAIDETNNETRYSQTLGTHLRYKKARLALVSNIYYQFGKDVGDNTISAYLLGLDVHYDLSAKWKAILGVEFQSGNDGATPSNGENKAFNPFYGTNHKFNGLMDYFFVGNHINSVGLGDFFLKSNIVLGGKSRLSTAVHYFSAVADIPNSDSKQLATELDLVYTYRFSKDITIRAGYSHLFASEGIEVLRNNFDGNTNNWGWVMVTIKPTLFTTTDK